MDYVPAQIVAMKRMTKAFPPGVVGAVLPSLCTLSLNQVLSISSWLRSDHRAAYKTMMLGQSERYHCRIVVHITKYVHVYKTTISL